MKKITTLLLALLMAFTITMPVSAASAPVLTLDKNQYNENDERHIKIKWEGPSKSYVIEIDDNEDFTSPTMKVRSVYHIRKNGKFYNFVLSENVDATYYIRIRTIDSNEWSNVVIADIEENKIESKPTAYLPMVDMPEIPDISGSIKIPKIKIDLSHLNFTFK